MTRRPSAVILDMDGLMLDTEPIAARAWTGAATAIGIEFDHAVTASLVGRNFADCRALIVARHGAGYPVDSLMQAWHAAYDAIVACEGITLKLARVALAERFDALVGGDEPARGKPAPDIFLLAAERLHVAAADCVVLEDSEPGIRGAIAAGMTPLLVPDNAEPAATLAELAPMRFDDLHGVRAHLAALPSA